MLFTGEGFGGLPEDNPSSAGILHRQGRKAYFLYRERLFALFTCNLESLFFRDCAFFLSGAADDRFHAAGAQCDPTIPSSAFLVPPASSPYLDANEEIGLQVIESSDCLTLQPCQTNKMWGGEPVSTMAFRPRPTNQ